MNIFFLKRLNNELLRIIELFQVTISKDPQFKEWHVCCLSQINQQFTKIIILWKKIPFWIGRARLWLEGRLKLRLIKFLNPFSAGVLENQDMLGGGSIWPPPTLYIPCLMSKYDKWYIIGKLSCSTFAKILFFITKSSNIEKIFAKKTCPKKNYTFLKSPWPWHFKYAKFLQNIK